MHRKKRCACFTNDMSDSELRQPVRCQNALPTRCETGWTVPISPLDGVATNERGTTCIACGSHIGETILEPQSFASRTAI